MGTDTLSAPVQYVGALSSSTSRPASCYPYPHRRGCLHAGLYDPWSPYGVLQDISDTVVAVIIPEVRPACSRAIRHLAWVEHSPLAFRGVS